MAGSVAGSTTSWAPIVMRQGPPHGGEVGGDDRLDARPGQGGDDRQPDRPGAEHDRGVAGLDCGTGSRRADPTAMGSVSAARRASSPLGTSRQSRSLSTMSSP